MFFSHFLNLFSSNCFYNLFNSVEQDYQSLETWINVEILFYFVKSYCSDSAKMLEIVNQLSACLCKNCDNFCKWFSHCFEKDIKDFIYVRNIEFFEFSEQMNQIILFQCKKYFVMMNSIYTLIVHTFKNSAVLFNDLFIN